MLRWDFVGDRIPREQAKSQAFAKLRFNPQLVPRFAEIYDVGFEVASRTLRPLLCHLLSTGVWRQNEHGRYRISNNSHTFDFSQDMLVNRYYRVQAMPRPRPSRSTGRTWAPHVQDFSRPNSRDITWWERLVPEASALPVVFFPDALRFYCAYTTNMYLGATTFVPTFLRMAQEAPTVMKRRTHAASEFIRDSQGYLWAYSDTPSMNSSKPCITGIYPPERSAAELQERNIKRRVFEARPQRNFTGEM